MVVGSATLSIAQLMRPTGSEVPVFSREMHTSEVGTTQYIPSLSLLADVSGGGQPSFSMSLPSPYARVADTMRSALVACGINPKTAMCVSQMATGCRIDLMLHDVAAAASVNHTASTTASAAATRASMAMFKASLPRGVVLSENWYTWLHLHALGNCIDACVQEMRKTFGDAEGEDEVSAGDADLAFSRLLSVF